MTPASSATAVPAAKAFRMNGNWRSCSTTLAIAMERDGVRMAHNDEPAVARAEHLDRRRVERAQRLAGDDLLRPAHHGPASGQVQNAVEVGQDRVDVVGHHHDGDPLLAAD